MDCYDTPPPTTPNMNDMSPLQFMQRLSRAQDAIPEMMSCAPAFPESQTDLLGAGCDTTMQGMFEDSLCMTGIASTEAETRQRMGNPYQELLTVQRKNVHLKGRLQATETILAQVRADNRKCIMASSRLEAKVHDLEKTVQQQAVCIASQRAKLSHVEIFSYKVDICNE